MRWQDCSDCADALVRTGLPVVCNVHADSSSDNQKCSEIRAQLDQCELLREIKEERDSILNWQMNRVDGWKVGRIRA